MWNVDLLQRDSVYRVYKGLRELLRWAYYQAYGKAIDIIVLD